MEGLPTRRTSRSLLEGNVFQGAAVIVIQTGALWPSDVEQIAAIAVSARTRHTQRDLVEYGSEADYRR
jgi:hypothetical protein